MLGKDLLLCHNENNVNHVLSFQINNCLVAFKSFLLKPFERRHKGSLTLDKQIVEFL